ncbi:class F sortase [Aquipuribacter sp. SD81]|uniref:class F sortase n=1 Tax=Aquipuribacter sp. SD81 TaxID=3127703 RepID=UPI003018FDD1
MATDAGRPRAARRPARTVLATVLGVLLVLGGGTAVVAGLSGRDAAAPPAVPVGGVSATPAPTASAPSPTPTAPAATGAAAGDGAQGRALAAPPSATPSPEPSTSSPAPVAAAPVAAPVAVRVPAAAISSELLHLGLQDDGTLEVPEGPDFDTAAWFDGSPRPGEVGPAVLLGHVSSAARGPSVFYELGDLRPGDRVEVDRADGTTAAFEVYEVQQFPKEGFPTLQVYGNTPGPELRLITCGGTIAESTGHFEDNVVIFAREV